LKVSTEKTGPREYELNLEVEAERLVNPLRQAARRLNTRRPLSGFRPGKAPYDLVERIYGKEAIYDAMLDKIGNQLYQEALQEAQIEPYTQARFETVQLEPLILKFTVPAQPEVTLANYHGIRVQQAEATVTDEEVQQVLAQMQDEHALWVPAERAVKMGDQVVVDAVGTTDDEQEIEEKDLTLQVTEEMTPPEFSQNLIGIKPGEGNEFDVQYPADFRDPDLAGKRAHFQVSLKAVKEKELPALDDELAQSLGPYETLGELRADIQTKLLEHKETEAKDVATEEALNALVEQSTLEYPNIAVEHEIDQMVASLANRLSRQGFTLEHYLEMEKKTLAQFREETRPRAEARLQRALVLAEFAEAEGIKVEQKDIDQEIERLSQSFDEQQIDTVKAALRKGDALRSITNDLYSRKVLDHLLAITTGQAQPRPEESEAANKPNDAKVEEEKADQNDT